MAFLIHPKVHRALYQSAIKEFIANKGIDVTKELEKNNISLGDDMPYSRLLDVLLEEQISVASVTDFLYEELNYGKMRNIYINKIIDVSALLNENKIIECINKLKEQGIIDADRVNKSIYKGDLSSGISFGRTKLLYSEIIKENDKISSIKLLIADCIKNKDMVECNNYYPIEIDIKDRMLIIRLKNWSSANINNENVDRVYKAIESKIAKAFSLELQDMTALAQATANKIVDSLIKPVLDEPMNIVRKFIEESVNTQVRSWADVVLPNSKDKMTNSDFNILKQIILNNYCKHYMINEIESIEIKELKEKYKVDGYPRSIRFVDDTVSEGRARSQDTKESLLRTSIFYDVKARLDHAKNIKLVTIYWLTCECVDRFGLSIYTDSQGKFKVIFLPHHYNKEMYVYVLQQIKKHMPA